MAFGLVSEVYRWPTHESYIWDSWHHYLIMDVTGDQCIVSSWDIVLFYLTLDYSTQNPELLSYRIKDLKISNIFLLSFYLYRWYTMVADPLLPLEKGSWDINTILTMNLGFVKISKFYDQSFWIIFITREMSFSFN